MGNNEFKLTILWLAVMLTYLLGDVLRIYAGDFKAGMVEGEKMVPVVWLGIALLMFVPIGMMLLNAFVQGKIILVINIIAAIILFIFNAIGLPSYKAPYDSFLIVVGLLLNVLTIWISWRIF